MSFKNYREESQKIWGSSEGAQLNIEQINCGAILRIADATEKMASNYIALENDYKWMKSSKESWRREAERLRKSNAALRGHLNRLKKLNSKK